MTTVGPITDPIVAREQAVAGVRRRMATATGFVAGGLVAALVIAVSLVAWRAESSPQSAQDASTLQSTIQGYPAVPEALLAWLPPTFTTLDQASVSRATVPAAAAVQTSVRRIGSTGATGSRAHVMLAWVTDESAPAITHRLAWLVTFNAVAVPVGGFRHATAARASTSYVRPVLVLVDATTGKLLETDPS